MCNAEYRYNTQYINRDGREDIFPVTAIDVVVVDQIYLTPAVACA